MSEKNDTVNGSGGLDAARERLEEAAERVGERFDRAQHRAEEAAHDARGRYDEAMHGLRQGYSQVSRSVGDFSDDFEDWVHDNPARAVMLASVIGFFFGLLLRGRR